MTEQKVDLREVYFGLKRIGFSEHDVGAVLGLSPGTLSKLSRGMTVTALDERHGLSNYLGFTRRAKAWIAAREAK